MAAAGAGLAEFIPKLTGPAKHADRKDAAGATALHAAVQNGHTEVVEALIARKVDVNATTRAKQSPLMYAVNTDSPTHTIVAALLKAKADVNAVDKKGISPLLFSVSGQIHLGVVAALLKAGANPNLADTSKRTPLHEAAFVGHLPAVRLLLEHGADKAPKTGMERRRCRWGEATTSWRPCVSGGRGR